MRKWNAAFLVLFLAGCGSPKNKTSFEMFEETMSPEQLQDSRALSAKYCGRKDLSNQEKSVLVSMLGEDFEKDCPYAVARGMSKSKVVIEHDGTQEPFQAYELLRFFKGIRFISIANLSVDMDELIRSLPKKDLLVIKLVNAGIASLRGLEKFPDLLDLDLTGNLLSEPDVSLLSLRKMILNRNPLGSMAWATKSRYPSLVEVEFTNSILPDYFDWASLKVKGQKPASCKWILRGSTIVNESEGKSREIIQEHVKEIDANWGLAIEY